MVCITLVLSALEPAFAAACRMGETSAAVVESLPTPSCHEAPSQDARPATPCGGVMRQSDCCCVKGTPAGSTSTPVGEHGTTLPTVVQLLLEVRASNTYQLDSQLFPSHAETSNLPGRSRAIYLTHHSLLI